MPKKGEKQTTQQAVIPASVLPPTSSSASTARNDANPPCSTASGKESPPQWIADLLLHMQQESQKHDAEMQRRDEQMIQMQQAAQRREQLLLNQIKLLTEDLTFEKAAEIVRQAENAANTSKQLENHVNPAELYATSAYKSGQSQQSNSHNQQPRDNSQSTHTQPRHRSRTPGFHGCRQNSQPRTTALEPSTSQSADINGLTNGLSGVNVLAAPSEPLNVTVTTQNGMQPMVETLPATDTISSIPEQMEKSFGYSVRDIPTVQSCPQTATGMKITAIGTLPAKVTIGLHEADTDIFILRDLAKPILSQHVLKTLKLIPHIFPFEHISDVKVSMTESLPSPRAPDYDPEFDASLYTFPFDPGPQVFIKTYRRNRKFIRPQACSPSTPPPQPVQSPRCSTHKVNRNLKTNHSVMFKDDVTVIPDSVDKQPPDRPKRSSKPPQRLDL